MLILKILTSFDRRLCSDLHPLYRWERQLKEQGIALKTFYDYKDEGLKDTDTLIVYNRYLKKQFKSNDQLISCLVDLKREVKNLIWFDAADSSGTKDFFVIPYVDIFLKKQILRDTRYYTGAQGNKSVRIWLEKDPVEHEFIPCPENMLHKIRIGWNLSYSDYRPYNPRLKLYISNNVGYWFYPNHFYEIEKDRPLDLTFRGTVKYADQDQVSFQRNKVLAMLDSLKLNIAHGKMVSRNQYLHELSNSKVSISPFGWGEVCYRDFESFICGSLLIKPSMNHVITFPDIFLDNETYIPVRWDLEDLQCKAENIVGNYGQFKHIAKNGQESYLRVINDSQNFINHLKIILEG